MPASINNFFGDNASVLTAITSITASTADPVLVIRHSDFASQSWNNLASGDQSNPEKWMSAIIRKINDYSNVNTGDDTLNVVVTDPILGLEVRSATLKRRYSYSVDVYQADTGSTQPDPDLV
jgi:hypothetical protein